MTYRPAQGWNFGGLQQQEDIPGIGPENLRVIQCRECVSYVNIRNDGPPCRVCGNTLCEMISDAEFRQLFKSHDSSYGASAGGHGDPSSHGDPGHGDGRSHDDFGGHGASRGHGDYRSHGDPRGHGDARDFRGHGDSRSHGDTRSHGGSRKHDKRSAKTEKHSSTKKSTLR